MKPCLFFLATVCALSAHAEDWRVTLTPPKAGRFPPPRPMIAHYRFGWSAVTAGEGDFEFSRLNGQKLQLLTSVETVGMVRNLWRLDAESTSVCTAATLRPVSVQQREVYRKKTLLTKLGFTPQGVERLRESVPPGEGPPKVKKFEFPAVFDLHSALLFVRSQPLEKGDRYRFVVYPTTGGYLAEAQVLGVETVKIAGASKRGIKLGLKLRKIAKDFTLEPHKQFKRGTVWISDDAERLLLRAQAEISVGSVWAELESVQFTAP